MLLAPNITRHLPQRPAPSQRLIHEARRAEKKDTSRFKQRSDLTPHCVRVDSYLRRRFSIRNMLGLFRNARRQTARDCGLMWRYIVLFDQTTCTCRGFHCPVNQTAILVLEISGRLLATITRKSGCVVTQILNVPRSPPTPRRRWIFPSNCVRKKGSRYFFSDINLLGKNNTLRYPLPLFFLAALL